MMSWHVLRNSFAYKRTYESPKLTDINTNIPPIYDPWPLILFTVTRHMRQSTNSNMLLVFSKEKCKMPSSATAVAAAERGIYPQCLQGVLVGSNFMGSGEAAWRQLSGRLSLHTGGIASCRRYGGWASTGITSRIVSCHQEMRGDSRGWMGSWERFSW